MRSHRNLTWNLHSAISDRLPFRLRRSRRVLGRALYRGCPNPSAPLSPSYTAFLRHLRAKYRDWDTQSRRRERVAGCFEINVDGSATKISPFCIIGSNQFVRTAGLIEF